MTHASDTPDAIERLVNLALYFSNARSPVSAKDIRRDVAGYPDRQDDASFLRMFERDKDDLRVSGLAIVACDDDPSQYMLDREATYIRDVQLETDQIAVLRAVGAALAEDPSFPFRDDLRAALMKLLGSLDEPRPLAASRLADEAPSEQGELAAEIASAIISRKRMRFTYTTSVGVTKGRSVDPYGMFLREGRWYLVGRDSDRDDLRVFALARVAELTVERSRPKSPDFERPADFDVAAFVRLPFQYGPEKIDALLRLSSDAAWRLRGSIGVSGELSQKADGALWRVAARDGRRLLRWVVENGPGIELVSPAELRESLGTVLGEVIRCHDG